MNVKLELYDTNGAIGAALGAGVGAGVYSSIQEAISGLNKRAEFVAEKEKTQKYLDAYTQWKNKMIDLKLI